MQRKTPAPQQGGSNVVMGGGENAGFAYVSGEQLKQVDTPVETLLGAANGAVTGAVVGGIGSALVTAANYGKDKQAIVKNLTGKHMLPILGASTAMAGLGALVRYSRATKHNEWSERHYNFMEQGQGNNEMGTPEPQGKYSEKVQSERAAQSEESLQR